ncbi:MAG: GNAT family protein [Myxococcota bacterium]
MAREATGRGLATAAARGVAAQAVGAQGVERLTMRCDVRNLASNRVAAKLGATPTGEEGAAGVAGEPVVLRRWELRADGMNVAR